MRTGIITLFVLCAAVCSAQLQQGYYTSVNMVPHIVKIKNGSIYIEAGSETAIYSGSGGKYVLKGYFYNGNESNMRAPISKNPPYLMLQSNTSYKYCTASGQENLYRLDATQTKQFEVLFDPAKLDDDSGTRSNFVDASQTRVEEIAPNYEKYMQKAKDDPDNAQVWFTVAHVAVLVSSYQGRDEATLNDLLLIKAKYIQRIAPYIKENPCPEVIPQEVWDRAKQENK